MTAKQIYVTVLVPRTSSGKNAYRMRHKNISWQAEKDGVQAILTLWGDDE
jgi:hypothetical protein